MSGDDTARIIASVAVFLRAELGCGVEVEGLSVARRDSSSVP
jgi:hypothetical protein